MSKFCTIGNCHCDDNGMAKRVAELERQNAALREALEKCSQPDKYNGWIVAQKALAALSAADANKGK